MTDTSSTGGIEDALRTRLLTFTPLVGADTLADVLGTDVSGAGSDGRLFTEAAPDGVNQPDAYLYGVMAYKNRRSIQDIPEGEQGELEVMLFARPRTTANAVAIKLAGDLCEQAMIRFKDATSGLIWCIGKSRTPLPVMTAPADRDVIQEMLTFTLRVYPVYTNQYSDTV